MSGIFSREFIDVLGREPLVVADLGARGGLDEDLMVLAPAVVAVGFEPDVQEAARLGSLPTAPWKARRILPYAIGGASGSATLHLTAAPEAASLLPHNPVMLEAFGHLALHKILSTADVMVRTLDDAASEAAIEKIDYLKIDIEGAELDVLKGGPKLLASVKVLKIECAFVEQRLGQPLACDVVNYLARQGFDLFDLRAIHHWRRRPLPVHPYMVGTPVPYSRGRIVQADLFFLKRPDALTLGGDGAAAMAILAAIGHIDLAFTLLRSLPVAGQWWSERGLDIRAELEAASYALGRRELKKALRAQFRNMLPLIRSYLGKLPYNKPEMEY